MIKEGGRAPAFKLQSDSGEYLSLKEYKGKNLVLYFYPKDMTSGCTTEALDFSENMALLKKKGALVVGISKDSIESHEKFKKKYKLSFPLLADVDGEMVEAYGVWKEKSMYGRKYMGIERTTVIINADGKIAKIFPKVKVANHVKAVLEALSEI